MQTPTWYHGVGAAQHTIKVQLCYALDCVVFFFIFVSEGGAGAVFIYSAINNIKTVRVATGGHDKTLLYDSNASTPLLAALSNYFLRIGSGAPVHRVALFGYALQALVPDVGLICRYRAAQKFRNSLGPVSSPFMWVVYLARSVLGY